MSTEEIITSGKLELYICGSLPQEEALEIEEAIVKHPELKKEVEAIEASLIHLSEAVAPPLPAMIWSHILTSISKVKNIKDSATTKTNWSAISGWAATIICIGGIFWLLKQTNDLQEKVQYTTTENTTLQEKVDGTETKLAETNKILDILRSKEYNTIILPGNQAVISEAFAKVYYNSNSNIAYFDTKGLPTPPEGKEYQVWSLIMDPLTPTSIGLLNTLTEVENDVYKFDNIPFSEAFGITLEPEGGSDTPTLSQLYTLGVIAP